MSQKDNEPLNEVAHELEENVQKTEEAEPTETNGEEAELVAMTRKRPEAKISEPSIVQQPLGQNVQVLVLSLLSVNSHLPQQHSHFNIIHSLYIQMGQEDPFE